jgi:tetratricopeptide (TPR) repeat protein
MKTRIQFCLLFLLTFPYVSVFGFREFGSKDAKAIFKEANANYAAGQYKQAISLYKDMLGDDFESAKIYFNIGSASYKLNDIPSSILYFEKANKLSPWDEDIRYNLAFVNQKTTDKLEKVPEFFLFTTWKTILLCPLDILNLVSIVFFSGGFLLLIFYLFSPSVPLKKLSFYSSLFFIIIGLLSIMLSEMQDSYLKNHQEAIIFSQTVSVKSAPNNLSKALFIIHDGSKVSILAHENDWIQIQLPNGNIGWIEASGAREI